MLAQLPPSPKFIYIQVNRRCNLRCLHCDFWKLDDNNRTWYLKIEDRRWVLAEFAELGGQVVVTCGGEPMLDVEDYFDLTKTARGLGLRMFSVINGTRVHTSKRAEQMVLEGPTEITVSLDSHIAAEHDRLRGVKGSWEVAVRALRLLLEARKKLETSTRIYAMTIVCESNWRELESFYEFALRDLGVDKLKLNILQPTFGHPAGELDDAFFGAEQVSDPAALVEIVKSCDVRFGLGISPTWLNQVAMYFDSIARSKTALRGWSSPAGTLEHICNTYERNIMVDVEGMARLCFSTAFDGLKLRKPGDLRRFWCETAVPVRQEMASCNRYCGISHSVRRESATLRTGK